MALSRRFAKGAIAAVVLGLIAVLAFGVWRGRTQQSKQLAPPGEASEPEMKLTDMDYTEMQGGRRLWTIKASEATYFQTEQKTALKSVLLTFFLTNGDEVHLESKNGILYAGSKNIELWDSVHAMLPQGYELFTDRAFYEHAHQTISSQTGIRLTGSDLELEGECWQYRITEQTAVLEGGVKASLAFALPSMEPKK